jgi:hypothetical protein
MLYMIVEHYRNRDPLPVYRRFREHGRLTPEGLHHVSSWVDDKMECCFQLMRTANRGLLEQWIESWEDIVEFQVYPVISSEEAVQRLRPLL